MLAIIGYGRGEPQGIDQLLPLQQSNCPRDRVLRFDRPTRRAVKHRQLQQKPPLGVAAVNLSGFSGMEGQLDDFDALGVMASMFGIDSGLA
jgi:hypothetical protein